MFTAKFKYPFRCYSYDHIYFCCKFCNCILHFVSLHGNYRSNFTSLHDLNDVSLLVKPILAVSSDKQVTKGSNVTFGCNITAANPSTKMITWKSPMNELIKHSNGVVMMSSVSAKQGGRYICLASNRAGESNKAFTLTIGEYINTILHGGQRQQLPHNQTFSNCY